MTRSRGRVLVELCGGRRDSGWFSDLWRRYAPRVYVVKIAVNPARVGCSHFQGRRFDEYTPERLTALLAAELPHVEQAGHALSSSPPAGAASGAAAGASPRVPELQPLLDFIQRCEDWGNSPPGFPGVMMDVLLDLQPR